MPHHRLLILFLISLAFTADVAATDIPPLLNGHLQEIPLLEGWRFHLGDAPGAEAKTVADSTWQPVSVPHDW